VRVPPAGSGPAASASHTGRAPVAQGGGAAAAGAGEAGGEEEEGEEEEAPPCDYDAAGVLTTQLAAFSELRLLRAGAPPAGDAGGAPPADAVAAAPGQPRARAPLVAGARPPAADDAAAAPTAAPGGPSEGAVQQHEQRQAPPGGGAQGVAQAGGVAAGGLRVPQPPARQRAPADTPAAQPNASLDPRGGAAGAARRALAKGLAPVAVVRRMRGAAAAAAAGGGGGDGGGSGAGPGMPAPSATPAPGRPPVALSGTAGEAVYCDDTQRSLWSSRAVVTMWTVRGLAPCVHTLLFTVRLNAGMPRRWCCEGRRTARPGDLGGARGGAAPPPR